MSIFDGIIRIDDEGNIIYNIKWEIFLQWLDDVSRRFNKKYHTICRLDKMKKFDLILLKNEKPYKEYNLVKDMHGIVIKYNFDTLDVLFFNPENQGDYIIAKIYTCDVVAEKEQLSLAQIKEIYI